MIKSKIIKIIIFSLLPFIQSSIHAQGFPAPSVNVVKAELKALAPVAWVSGTLVSRNNSKLAMEVSGRLIDIAELGSAIKKGDVIARIDTQSLEINRRENVASVESAKAKLQFLESEVERISALAKRNLSAKNDLDETVSERDIAKGDLAAAEARLNQVIQSISFAQLKAPFDGVIAERLSNQGEYISSGTAVIRLVETAQLEASVFAPLTSYQYLKQADSLAVKSPLGSGLAPIKSLVPVANERSHLMQIRLDMSGFNWPVGLDIKVAVSNGDKKEVIAVPRDALVLRRDGISIFKITAENVAEQISVTVGVGAGEYVEVVGNVSVGDVIVIRGAENLRAGQAVQIKENNQSLISGNQTGKQSGK